MHILTTGSFSFYFHFQKVVLLLLPSDKWHHKQTKITFHITKFTLNDRKYPIIIWIYALYLQRLVLIHRNICESKVIQFRFECTYIRIEGILCPGQIIRAVKVWAI